MELVAAVLAGFVIAPFVPWIRRAGRDYTGWIIALVPLFICVYLATLIGPIADGETRRVSYDWIPSLHINLSFYVDGLSLAFGLLISGIGALIMVYAGGYLKGHHHLGRLYAYLLMFMGSMLGIVLADNIITLFVFWELTSITSYLLIGFNHHEAKARSAALQALVVTVLGGQLMLGGLLILGYVSGSYELTEILTQGDMLREHSLYVPILLLILAGAFTKSAQVPFHFWLPGAMEAPTPVSAYLHSATMVKAGVYVLARFHPALGGTDLWTIILVTAGGLTMIVGAYLAFPQSDLKRVLAYSTVSALGTLVLLIGIGTERAIEGAVVFLLVHSLYKGALFLVAGIIDHGTGTRDINMLGGLRKAMPITAVVAGLAALSMAGLPPMFGFIGKELVYDALVEESGFVPRFVAGITVAANILLLVIAGIVGIGPFFGRNRDTPEHPHEAPPSLLTGPAVLAGLGLAIGLIPTLFIGSLIQPATQAILGDPVAISISLWHGFNPALALSAITVGVGVGIYFGRGRLRPIALQIYDWRWYGPERAFPRIMEGLDSIALTQTRLLQSGFLRYYLLTIIITTVAVVSYPLFGRGELFDRPDFGDVRFYEIGLGVLLLMAAFQAARSNSRLGAIAALGVVGYGVALIYIFYGAPDLAMTQVLVETLMVVLLVLVFYRLPRYVQRSTRGNQVRDAIVALTAGGMMTALILASLSFEDRTTISAYFDENSVPLAHGRNIVNVILVDFRALDTLGEITVLAVAAAGVFALLRLRLAEPQDEEADRGA
ncbi:MAG: putative monovalent cation/H+ antiporter subunit A [Chloroflexia bacterium]|nr:putative monovalent cation/H+ antiporter subunit A [Chloroflexia bacterium]